MNSSIALSARDFSKRCAVSNVLSAAKRRGRGVCSFLVSGRVLRRYGGCRPSKFFTCMRLGGMSRLSKRLVGSCIRGVGRRLRVPKIKFRSTCFHCVSKSVSVRGILLLVTFTNVILMNKYIMVRDVFHVSVVSGVGDCKRLQAVNTAGGRVVHVMGGRKRSLK